MQCRSWPMSRPGASPILIAGSAQPSCRTLRDRRKELTSECACQSAITGAGHKSMGGARLCAPHTQGPHARIAFWRWRAGLGGGPERRPPNTAGLADLRGLHTVFVSSRKLRRRRSRVFTVVFAERRSSGSRPSARMTSSLSATGSKARSPHSSASLFFACDPAHFLPIFPGVAAVVNCK